MHPPFGALIRESGTHDGSHDGPFGAVVLDSLPQAFVLVFSPRSLADFGRCGPIPTLTTVFVGPAGQEGCDLVPAHGALCLCYAVLSASSDISVFLAHLSLLPVVRHYLLLRSNSGEDGA